MFTSVSVCHPPLTKQALYCLHLVWGCVVMPPLPPKKRLVLLLMTLPSFPFLCPSLPASLCPCSCLAWSPALSVHPPNTPHLPLCFLLLPLRDLGPGFCSVLILCPWSRPPSVSISRGTFWRPCPCQIQGDTSQWHFLEGEPEAGRLVMESGKQQPRPSMPQAPGSSREEPPPSLVSSRPGPSLSSHSGPSCLFLVEQTFCKVHPPTDFQFSPPLTCPGLFCQALQRIRVRGG